MMGDTTCALSITMIVTTIATAHDPGARMSRRPIGNPLKTQKPSHNGFVIHFIFLLMVI